MALDANAKKLDADKQDHGPEVISANDNKLRYDSDVPSKDGAFVSTASDSDDDSEAYQDNPFLDPDVAAKWALVYEKSQYECRHVFDPTFTWTREEEAKLVRRLDWRVCLWACVMFFGLQVDRGNLAQAVADNLLKDLHLTTNGKITFCCVSQP